MSKSSYVAASLVDRYNAYGTKEQANTMKVHLKNIEQDIIVCAKLLHDCEHLRMQLDDMALTPVQRRTIEYIIQPLLGVDHV